MTHHEILNFQNAEKLKSKIPHLPAGIVSVKNINHVDSTKITSEDLNTYPEDHSRFRSIRSHIRQILPPKRATHSSICRAITNKIAPTRKCALIAWKSKRALPVRAAWGLRSHRDSPGTTTNLSGSFRERTCVSDFSGDAHNAHAAPASPSAPSVRSGYRDFRKPFCFCGSATRYHWPSVSSSATIPPSNSFSYAVTECSL